MVEDDHSIEARARTPIAETCSRNRALRSFLRDERRVECLVRIPFWIEILGFRDGLPRRRQPFRRHPPPTELLLVIGEDERHYGADAVDAIVERDLWHLLDMQLASLFRIVARP